MGLVADNGIEWGGISGGHWVKQAYLTRAMIQNRPCQGSARHSQDVALLQVA